MMMKRGLLGTLLAVALARGLWAQLPAGGWLTGNEGYYVTYFSEAFVPQATPNAWGAWATAGGGIAVDGDRMVYVTDSPWSVYRISYDPQLTPGARLVVEAPGSSFPYPAYGVLPQIVAARDRLWFVEATGVLRSVGKSVIGQIPVRHGNSIWVPNTNVLGTVQSLCTDGRLLFFSTGLFDGLSGSPSVPQNDIWSVDLRAPTIARRHVAAIPGDSWTQLCMGLDGDVLAMRMDGLRRIVPETGSVTFVCGAPNHVHFSGSVSGKIFMAYDPWQDKVAVGAGWLPNTTHIQWKDLTGNGAWSMAYYFPFFATLRKFTCASEPPFQLFGVGCVNAIGKEPRMGWRGLPRQGQTFTLKLRDAEPNGLAAFWVGMSDSFWPGIGALPFEASNFGAPGCRMYASSEFSLFTFADSQGNASMPMSVPMNPALHGFEVFAQTVSTSGANALGFAASEAVAIRLR